MARMRKSSVEEILASGFARAYREQLKTITRIYAPAVRRTPKISLAGIVRDATLYPANPRA
jgi:hypothetical protein